MKHLLTVMSVLSVLAFAGTPALAASQTKAKTAEAAKVQTEKKISKSTATLELDIKYPVIGQAAIDQDIQAFIDKSIADFGPGEANENWKSWLSIEYKLSKVQDKYLSVRFYVYVFTGGAHGAQSVNFKTYDLSTGKALSYSDIFNDGYDYLKALWQNCEPQIISSYKYSGWGETLSDREWIREGAKPSTDNYQNFYLTDKGLVVYFGEYQVGPHAIGTIEVPVRWEKMLYGLKEPFASYGLSKYQNTKYGFELSYPKSLKPEKSFKSSYHLPSAWRAESSSPKKGSAIVSIPVYRISNNKAYPRYFAAEVRVGVSNDGQEMSDCLKGLSNGTASTTEINGTSFLVSEIKNAGMMQYLEGRSYSTLYGGYCFVIEALKTGSSYREEANKKDISDGTLDSYYQKALEIIKTLKFTN